MKTLELSNGDKIPQFGLGTWLSAKGEVYLAIRKAIEIGYKHFDCAAIYANEVEIGKAFKDAFDSGDIKREEVWITSKLWNSSHRINDVEPAIAKSLKDLQLDYLDLYLIHWPITFQNGISMPEKAADFLSLDEIPLGETWRGMEQVLNNGQTKHIGVSNFSAPKIDEILKTSIYPPEVNQCELHPFLQQNDLLTYCQNKNIIMTGYSPLGRPGSGLSRSLIDDPVITGIAESLEATPAQVLIAWAIHRGTVIIPKSVTPKRLEENFTGQSITLTVEQMETILLMDLHFRFVDGTFWEMEGLDFSAKKLWDE